MIRVHPGALPTALCVASLALSGCAALFEPEAPSQPPPPPQASAPAPSPLPAEKPKPDPDLVVLGAAAAPDDAALQAMTFEELQTCANRLLRIDADEAELKSLGAGIESRRRDLDRRSSELQRLGSAPKLAGKKLREYRDKSARHGEKVQRFNEDVLALNGQATQARGQVDDFNSRCSRRAYRKSDAAKLEQAAAAALTRVSVTLEPTATPLRPYTAAVPAAAAK